MLPTLSCLIVSCEPDSRLRHRCSTQSLRISPLHWVFHYPLSHSSTEVSQAVPKLSLGISPATLNTDYARFTPSNSEQRLHPLYYRGCWHRVCRCFLHRYHQNKRTFPSYLFFPVDRALQPEGLPHSRGVAASDFRPLRNIPYCCLP